MTVLSFLIVDMINLKLVRKYSYNAFVNYMWDCGAPPGFKFHVYVMFGNTIIKHEYVDYDGAIDMGYEYKAAVK